MSMWSGSVTRMKDGAGREDTCSCEKSSHMFLPGSGAIDILFERVYKAARV